MSAIEKTGISYQKVETPQVDANFINVSAAGSVSFIDDEAQTTNNLTEGFVGKSKITRDKVETPTVNVSEVSIANGGLLTFKDDIDGTVFETETISTGYRYVQSTPKVFNNGICYDIGELSDTTNLTHVSFSAAGRLIQTCELWFTTPATAPTKHKWPNNVYWIDSPTGAAPTLLASKNYRVVFRQEPNKIIASIAYIY